MGRDAEIFKAAQSGNVEFLERLFASYLALDKDSPQLKGKTKKQSSVVR